MLQSLKRLTRHSAIYGLSNVLGRSMAFLLVPVYTHVIPTDEFGYFALIYSFIALMNVVFIYGMDAAFLRFYLLDDTKKRETLSTGYLTMIFTSVALAGLVALTADYIAPLIATSASLASYVRMAAVILAFDALNVIPFARLRGEGKAPLFAALGLVKVILELIGNYWLVVVQGMGLTGILISNMLGSGLIFLVLMPVTLRHVSFLWVRTNASALLKFGLPYVPAGACIIVIETIGTLMLERMADTATVGIYQAIRKMGVGMLLFVNMFRLAWQPFFLETSKQTDARPIFARVLTYFLVIISGVFLCISFLIDDLITLRIGEYTFFKETYWDGIGIVPPLLIAYILYGIYVNLTVGIYLEKKTIILPVITGTAALLCILTNLALIPSFGMYGAVMASVVAYGVMVVGMYIVSHTYYPIPYEYMRIVKVLLVCGVIYMVRWYMEGGWLLEMGLLAMYPVLLIAIRFFNAQEVTFVKQRLRLLRL
ncbi:MAG: oligosaccharide flippase family protein [Gemmatimonadota bacterium]|nr:oligosaccharide flippase family protein [Gemmatimonadota bacterium]